MQACAKEVMAGSPITYVKDARLCGNIFEPESPSSGVNGPVSCVNTEFFVDHQEPLDALKWIQEDGGVWPLGDLPDGHEFLLAFESSSRRRRSLSSRRAQVEGTL